MSRRDLAALITVVVVAVPGLAIAQQAPETEPEVEQTEPETETEDPAEVETEDGAQEPESDADESTAEVEGEAAGEDTVDGPEAEVEAEDDGHGELVSALARCLPSGRELHGTGLTKGAVISQVASTGTFTADGSTTEVTTPEDAEALCAEVQAMADAAEAPETAKGRPSWAGSDDAEEADVAEEPEAELEAEEDGEVEDDAGEDDGEVEDDGEATAAEDDQGGPPDHAAAKGRRGR